MVIVGFNPRMAMTRKRFAAEMRGSPTRMKLVVNRVEMVQSSLRDEIVWRDDSAEADELKSTATFGGRSAIKARSQ